TVEATTRDGDRVLKTLPEVQLRLEPKVAFRDAVVDQFAEQMQGIKAGDSKTLEVDLSTAVGEEGLRGKKVQLALQVKDVKKLRAPDESGHFFGGFGVKNEQQFEELLRVMLQRRMDYMERQGMRRQVTEQLAAQPTWQLPEDLLARQATKTL